METLEKGETESVECIDQKSLSSSTDERGSATGKWS